jgi:hypothetical protein
MGHHNFKKRKSLWQLDVRIIERFPTSLRADYRAHQKRLQAEAQLPPAGAKVSILAASPIVAQRVET